MLNSSLSLLESSILWKIVGPDENSSKKWGLSKFLKSENWQNFRKNWDNKERLTLSSDKPLVLNYHLKLAAIQLTTVLSSTYMASQILQSSKPSKLGRELDENWARIESAECFTGIFSLFSNSHSILVQFFYNSD